MTNSLAPLKKIQKIKSELWPIPKGGLLKSMPQRQEGDAHSGDNRSLVEHVPSVDLGDMLDRYSQQEIALILNNLTAIQLTQGCNGHCPFCLFGIKKGLESKFSYSSIKRFIETSWKSLPIQPALYWDSDPFDWNDSGRDFADIYKLTKDNGGGEFCLSTAIPEGTERSILNFVKIVAQEYLSHLRSGSAPFNSELRFSVARHNILRVENALKRIAEDVLPHAGYEDKEIKRFFSQFLTFNYIFGSKVKKVGALIRAKKDFGEDFSPACADGVIITPGGIKAIAMVWPSTFEPSGQISIPLLPGGAVNYVPKRIHLYKSQLSPHRAHLKKQFKSIPILSDIIRASDGRSYQVPSLAKDEVLGLRLSRLSLRLFNHILNMAHFTSKPDKFSEINISTSSKEVREFLNSTKEELADCRKGLQGAEDGFPRSLYYLNASEYHLKVANLLFASKS